MRAAHLLVDGDPPIFRDEHALGLSGFTADDATALVAGFDPTVGAVFRVGPLVRARFMEDQLDHAMAEGVGQYVVLGAGLDSLPWRRPDLAAALQPFEVDHPGTQVYKRERIAAAGLGVPAHLHFVPIDFAQNDDLAAALASAGFRPEQRSVWSWLGVTTYLTRPQIERTLQSVADISAPGSILVTDFVLARDLMDEVARAADDIGRPGAAEQGESYLSTFTPDEFAQVAEASGWRRELTRVPSDFASWFEGRADGLGCSSFLGLLVARR